MATVGLVLHDERTRAVDIALDAIEWLESRDHEARLPHADATLIGRTDLGAVDDELVPGLDVVLSLGGDGTMLRSVGIVGDSGVPIIGINVGQLGYLTEVEPDGARMALKRFLNGAYEIEDRMLVEARVEGDDEFVVHALNEAVIEKTTWGHTVRLAVSVDGDFFTTYAADGLIVASPTGSTAYSFSARGPIVSPTHRCLVLTPVSPHMLFDRTLVLDPSARVRLEVDGHRPATVSIDGRNVATLDPGQALVCSASQRSARFVTFGDHDFLAILKSKFGLSDR